MPCVVNCRGKVGISMGLLTSPEGGGNNENIKCA